MTKSKRKTKHKKESQDTDTAKSLSFLSLPFHESNEVACEDQKCSQPSCRHQATEQCTLCDKLICIVHTVSKDRQDYCLDCSQKT